ncbi:transcription factor RFX4-like [Physella acuta]|uniref:transcription factor RFX4-like n=1 Tax=Physella acuta TaxID=109671 RepID=UPI0027DC48C6|nr:transcription factor RFX4-like [Physella acuta]
METFDGKTTSSASSTTTERKGSKPHSTPLTLKWLQENYEIAEGVCIPRSTLYQHYLNFCRTNDTNPVNAASFGKIIRQQFPQITTRRLGTRGQSKYHYYGIGVRETSHFFDEVFSTRTEHTVTEGTRDPRWLHVSASTSQSKHVISLPEFPDVTQLTLPECIEVKKVTSFLIMYHAHCQRLLDNIVRGNFEQVHSLLLHFWQGMPGHVVAILGHDVIVKLIGVCDVILYRTLSDVFLPSVMPSVMQTLSNGLTQAIRRFTRQLEAWLRSVTSGLPAGLQAVKLELARAFCQILKRQTSLNHLIQASRGVIDSSDAASQLLSDWMKVDHVSILKQTLYTVERSTEMDHTLLHQMCNEFEKLLEQHAPIETYMCWLDHVVQTCVVKVSVPTPGPLHRVCRQFLLVWSCFGSRVLRDMTLQGAPSFGSFHLLHLTFNDYIHYRIELLHLTEKSNEFLRAIQGEVTQDFDSEYCSSEDDSLDQSRDGFFSDVTDYGATGTCLPESSHVG